MSLSLVCNNANGVAKGAVIAALIALSRGSSLFPRTIEGRQLVSLGPLALRAVLSVAASIRRGLSAGIF